MPTHTAPPAAEGCPELTLAPPVGLISVDDARFVAVCNDADNLHALVAVMHDAMDVSDPGSRISRVAAMALAERINEALTSANLHGHLEAAA